MNRIALALAVATTIPLMHGCGLLAQMYVAKADADQVPEVSTYSSKKTSDALFSAAMQAMVSSGRVVSSDRQSGILQGQRGNWLFNVTVSPGQASGGKLQVSLRYVPSGQMDFSSREDLLKKYVESIESLLGEKVQKV